MDYDIDLTAKFDLVYSQNEAMCDKLVHDLEGGTVGAFFALTHNVVKVT